MTLGSARGSLSYAGWCRLVCSVWRLGDWLDEAVLLGLLLPWVVVGTVYASRDILSGSYGVVHASTCDPWLDLCDGLMLFTRTYSGHGGF